MDKVIDVRDLPDEDVRFIQRLVDLLKEKARFEEKKRGPAAQSDAFPGARPSAVKGEERVDFAVWPLGVKGRLTRKEIYEDL